MGRNYLAHAAELGNPVPPEPLIFLKPPSALIGDDEPILIPRDVGQVDFEGEIGVVIARPTRDIPVDEAWSAVGWIVALNDVTARTLQRSDAQWTRAKGFDTFCPRGTAAAVGGAVDPSALQVVTRVNGEERQRGRASDMAFPIDFLVAWISRVMALEPGDVIATGTPEGVGPLERGDVVDVEIPGFSRVRNPVGVRPAAPPLPQPGPAG